MSDFVQQQHSVCDFGSSDSWVVLSPIEQNIKRKIEAVGTPLRDWNINIYRGVLTGCNEAFIIDTAKRNEILANCKDAKERRNLYDGLKTAIGIISEVTVGLLPPSSRNQMERKTNSHC